MGGFETAPDIEMHTVRWHMKTLPHNIQPIYIAIRMMVNDKIKYLQSRDQGQVDNIQLYQQHLDFLSEAITWIRLSSTDPNGGDWIDRLLNSREELDYLIHWHKNDIT